MANVRLEQCVILVNWSVTTSIVEYPLDLGISTIKSREMTDQDQGEQDFCVGHLVLMQRLQEWIKSQTFSCSHSHHCIGQLVEKSHLFLGGLLTANHGLHRVLSVWPDLEALRTYPKWIWLPTLLVELSRESGLCLGEVGEISSQVAAFEAGSGSLHTMECR